MCAVVAQLNGCQRVKIFACTLIWAHKNIESSLKRRFNIQVDFLNTASFILKTTLTTISVIFSFFQGGNRGDNDTRFERISFVNGLD